MTPEVAIAVFGLFHPAVLEIRPSRAAAAITVHCNGSARRLEGRQSMRLAPGCAASGRFLLSVPGKIEREFEGAVTVKAGPVAIVTMDLEVAVASVVAAEMPGDAPPAALQAQAIAARSYYVASPRGRHANSAFCDTTHCQHLKAVPGPSHPARAAAEATRGLVLSYESRPLAAMYSAACTGRRQAGIVNGYPYIAVECPYCRRNPAERRGKHEHGLCQAGAIDLARRLGKSAGGILRHYYPGATVTVTGAGPSLDRR